jgi:hypothetical protein
MPSTHSTEVGWYRLSGLLSAPRPLWGRKPWRLAGKSSDIEKSRVLYKKTVYCQIRGFQAFRYAIAMKEGRLVDRQT